VLTLPSVDVSFRQVECHPTCSLYPKVKHKQEVKAANNIQRTSPRDGGERRMDGGGSDGGGSDGTDGRTVGVADIAVSSSAVPYGFKATTCTSFCYDLHHHVLVSMLHLHPTPYVVWWATEVTTRSQHPGVQCLASRPLRDRGACLSRLPPLPTFHVVPNTPASTYHQQSCFLSIAPPATDQPNHHPTSLDRQ
jgi:hypothetical protein